MVDYHQFITLISQSIWPLFRISGMMIVVPIFSSGMVPRRIRALLAVLISFAIAGLIPQSLSFEQASSAYVFYVLAEIALGILVGFILQIVFQAFILGGQVVAMQMGLGFATMVDPGSNANVPLMSQFYLFLVTLVFLALNGHLMTIDLIVSSFKTMPIGHIVIDESTLRGVLNFSGVMFKGAVMVALPAIISLLLVNFSFGIMTRVSPQLNLFSIGFPITLTLGVIIVFITLYGILPHIQSLLNLGFKTIDGMIR